LDGDFFIDLSRLDFLHLSSYSFPSVFAKQWPITSTCSTVSSPPTVTTTAATGITSGSATLNGSVNPNGIATTVYFQWGTSAAYGNTVAYQSVGSGTSSLSVNANLTAMLSPSTTYHFRVVASNSKGTSYGSDKTFTTTAGSGGSAPGSFMLTATPECNGTNSQIRLNWTQSNGATRYDLYRNGTLILRTLQARNSKTSWSHRARLTATMCGRATPSVPRIPTQTHVQHRIAYRPCRPRQQCPP